MPELSATVSPRWASPLPAAVVCLVLNAAIGALIYANQPEYLRNYRLSGNPDALHYVLLGHNWFSLGEYSRCSAPPYVPDVLRTPIYPIFAGGLDLLGGAGLVYLAQALLHVASVVVLFGLVRTYFGIAAAQGASLFLATDSMIAVSNFEPMSEPLFLFLVLAATACLAPVVLASLDSQVKRRRTLLGGLLLALATLTRPTGLYLPLVFAACILARSLFDRKLAAAAGCTAILLLGSLIPIGGWAARNYSTFSLPRLTTNDAIMQVYFAGAGAYQIEHGMSLGDAQAAIAREYGLAPPEMTNNHWRADRSVAQMDAELRAATKDVLLKYPASLVRSCAWGIVKSSLSHNITVLANACGRKWNPPGAASLLKGDVSAVTRLMDNGPLLVALLVWQTLHAAATWLLMLTGVWIAVTKAQLRPFAMFLLLILAYFHLTVALVGCEAYCRSRTPHMPYAYAFAGVSAAWLCGAYWSTAGRQIN